MLSLPMAISLTDCRNGRRVAAQIVHMSRDLAPQMDATWWRDAPKAVCKQEDDNHWKWTQLLGGARSSENARFARSIAVLTDDGNIQGAALYYLNGMSYLEPDAGSVFADRLATAPRNRDWLVAEPACRGVGTALLRLLVAHSYDVGHGGRVNLLSFPRPQTVDFYEKFGFERTDVDEDDMILFELPPDTAVTLLRMRAALT